MAKTAEARAITRELYIVGSPPAEVLVFKAANKGRPMPTIAPVTSTRTSPPVSQPILNSLKNAVGCSTPQGMRTVPTSTAKWYSIIVIMRWRATKANATIVTQ
jgi:hypothetical protein